MPHEAAVIRLDSNLETVDAAAAFLFERIVAQSEPVLSRWARHPPRTLSMSDLAILRWLTTRKRSQHR
jgi:hypothetical protein